MSSQNNGIVIAFRLIYTGFIQQKIVFDNFSKARINTNDYRKIWCKILFGA